MPGDPAIQAKIDELVKEIYPQAKAEAWKVFQRAPHALELEELQALALGGLAHAAARWQAYCAERGHDPNALNYFGAYAIRRMRGAMLDAMRQSDWVTRSARTRAKAIRDAGQDRGKTDEELAEASGLSVREVRETIAAVAARPVSIDAEPHDMPDPGDVEGQVVVSSVLQAVRTVVGLLPPGVQELLALHYYHGWSVTEAARSLGVEEEEAARQHATAVLAIHDAMVRAVS